MPDPTPTKLTLPGKGIRGPANDLPPNNAPGVRPVIRPGATPGATDPVPGAASAESGDASNGPAPVAIPAAPPRTRRSGRRKWQQRWALFGVAFGAAVGGYLLGQWRAKPAPVAPEGPARIIVPTAAQQAELDTAFAALRSGRYAEARQLFVALTRKHPQWKALNDKVAIATLGAGDKSGFEKLVEQGELSGAIRPDESRMLLSQLSLEAKDYESAAQLLGESAGADPVRAETYYCWGECLLRWGKPKEAVAKFRAAQLRNIYPTAEALFESKLWIAEVESEMETTDGTAELIDGALAASHPTSPALLAAAARAVKAGQFAQAADYLSKAQQVSEPATFLMMLQDPYFAGEYWRPEIRPIYVRALGAAQGKKEPATDQP